MAAVLDERPGLLADIVGPLWSEALLADTVACMTPDQQERYARITGTRKPSLRAWRRSPRLKVKEKEGGQGWPKDSDTKDKA